MALTIALDGMGGDRAPDIVVDGAARALSADPELRFLIFGDEARLKPLVAARPGLQGAVEFRHTDVAIANDAKPSVAVRQGRTSSMRLAINTVKDQEAAAAVSAGNTGALMGMAKLVLRTLPGIDRPAICGLVPGRRAPVVILDLGANIDCDPAHLVQFAVMGTIFAQAILKLPEPRVGLINVGVEELKGDDVVRETAAILRRLPPPVHFAGFVEGTDIFNGDVDVVVTDGFTGNVALKVAEGTAKLMGDELRSAFSSSTRGKLGYLFARPALSRLRERFDPRTYNGAMFLGLGGVVVKSHGGTDGYGFGQAIHVAAALVRKGTNEHITDQMAKFGTLLEPVTEAAAS